MVCVGPEASPVPLSLLTSLSDIVPRLRDDVGSRRLCRLARVVLLLQLNLNLIADRLDLPPLPFPSPNQIADEKPFENRDQRHRENKKDGGEKREVEQKAEDRIDVAEGLLEQRQRVRPQCAVHLLNKRMKNGKVVLPTEERSYPDAAPQKGQRLKGFLGRGLRFSWRLIRHGKFRRPV